MSDEAPIQGVRYVPLSVALETLDFYLAPPLVEKARDDLKKEVLILPRDIAKGLDNFFDAVQVVFTDLVTEPLKKLEGIFLSEPRAQGEVPITQERREATTRLRNAFAAIATLLEACGADEDIFGVFDILGKDPDLIAGWLEVLEHLKELSSGMEESITRFEEALLKLQKAGKEELDLVEDEIGNRVEKQVQGEIRERVEILLQRFALEGIIPSEWTHWDSIPGDIRILIEQDVLEV